MSLPRRVLACVCTAFAVIAAFEDAFAQDLAWIEAERRAIRAAIGDYARIEKYISGQSTEGATAIAYRDGRGEVRFIEVTFFGETGRARYEVYYHERQAFFVLKQDYAYNAPFYMTEERAKRASENDRADYEAFNDQKTELREQRYYFGDVPAVQQGAPMSTVESGGFSARETADQILELSRDLLSRFRP